jgi:hypothetical protein
VDVRVDDAAAVFTLERGGEIYIWVNSSGLLEVKTAFKGETDDWERLPTEDVVVFVAPSAAVARSWRVTLGRFPWKHLKASSELTKSPGQDLIGSGF